MSARADLRSPDPRRRMRAIHRLGADPADRYALRDVLCFDGDARVRARAAHRLGSRTGLAMTDALIEAASLDSSPLVRETSWRSLARARPSDLFERHFAAAQHAALVEPVWWVRIAVVAAMANIPAQNRLAALRDILLDPFWRVRHVAVKALLAAGDSSAKNASDVRHAITATPVRTDVEGAALLYLKRGWSGERLANLEPTLFNPPSGDPLWDPDPAVITTRLESPSAKPSLEFLIELLADAHESTRSLAIEHLRRRGSLREARIALHWLDDPRIPYASASATKVASNLGAKCQALAADVLSSEPSGSAPRGSAPGKGALCWAMAFVAQTRASDFCADVEALLVHPEPQVQTEAIRCLGVLGFSPSALETIRTLAGQRPHPLVATACTRALLRAGIKDVAQELQSEAPVHQRRLLVERARRHEDIDALHVAVSDPDPRTRAAALRALQSSNVALGSLTPQTRAEAEDSADPWVRRAVLSKQNAAHVVQNDLDPETRRLALRLCFGETDAAARAAIDLAAKSTDARLRTGAAAMLNLDSPVELAALLRLTRDRLHRVRVAAASALAEADKAVSDLLSTTTDADVFVAGASWLCRTPATAGQRLDKLWTQALNSTSLSSDVVRHHLQTLRLVVPDDAVCSVEPLDLQATAPSVRSAAGSSVAPDDLTTRRRLGTTDLEISPIAISGVKGLHAGSLRKAVSAGVNLFFWEPRYHHLGSFLRSPDVRDTTLVVAGSYHASPDAIEKDVEIALRRLQRDHIDLFLIFWVRSAARLSPEVWACLQRLKQAGKIRACGFSSHHRDIAADAITSNPWDAIMVRHSAAHIGAEDMLLPLADERGVGVLGFTSLCYGRLLKPSPMRANTRAPDCYRYTLSQVGIDTVISAPSRDRELVENLSVLNTPHLAPDEIHSMRDHGAWVYANSKDFGALVRRTPRELPRPIDDAGSSTDTISNGPPESWPSKDEA